MLFWRGPQICRAIRRSVGTPGATPTASPATAYQLGGNSRNTSAINEAASPLSPSTSGG